MATTTEAPASTTTISETEAARRLGVKAVTLRSWRIKGKLADGVVTVTPSLLPDGRPAVAYDERRVDEHLDRDNGVTKNRTIFA